jgi:hypothetical protein
VRETHTIEISDTRKQYLVVFRIVLSSVDDVNKDKQIVPCFQPVVPDVLRINAKSFCQAFPYHILFEPDLYIVQCGVRLQKMCRKMVVSGVKLCDVFEMIQPNMTLSIDHLRRFINACFIIKEKEDKGSSAPRMVLKGTFRRLGTHWCRQGGRGPRTTPPPFWEKPLKLTVKIRHF